MDVVRLRHVTRTGDWMMYFYDGELPVEGSVLTIPADKPEWIQRAWIQGFRMTADGRVIADLAKHIRAETGDAPVACEHPGLTVEGGVAVCDNCGESFPVASSVTPVEETENAESDEENDDDEGAADRGQPADDDGVRAGEPDRDGSLPEGRVRGRRRNEPADGGEGDEPAD